MTEGLAATSVFVAEERGRRIDREGMPDEVRVSVITAGELRVGVLAADDPELRATRLATLQSALALKPVPVSEVVAEEWANLRGRLRAVGRTMPVNDSWIAATAIALGIPVVTQDHDYDGVPGLEVIKV